MNVILFKSVTIYVRLSYLYVLSKTIIKYYKLGKQKQINPSHNISQGKDESICLIVSRNEKTLSGVLVMMTQGKILKIQWKNLTECES